MAKEPAFLVRNCALIYKLELLENENIKVNGNSIERASREVVMELDFVAPVEHNLSINGKRVDFKYPLFSHKQDGTVAQAERHPDFETQAFIAFQNAKFSDDTAFRCSSLVILVYRIIEQELHYYDDVIHDLFEELLQEIECLPFNGSVRRNPFQLKISMLFVMYMLSLARENESLEKDVSQRLFNLLAKVDESAYIAPSLYNIVKFLSLIALKKSVVDPSIQSLCELSWKFLNLSFSKLKPTSSVVHLNEFSRSYNDCLQLNVLEKLLVSELASYRGKGVNEVKSEILASCIRFSNHSRLQIIKNRLKIK